jgi:hypothetical protein
MEKNEKKINIYEVAGKVGKGVKKCGGYALAIAGTLVLAKGSDVIKKIKK